MSINNQNTPLDMSRDYIVIFEDEENADKFCRRIEDAMKLGYSPVGGVATRTGSSYGAYLIQALIKDNEPTITVEIDPCLKL